MTGVVSVPISCGIYNEFSLRCGESVDPASWIENIVRDYLERTKGDAAIWGDKHAEQVEQANETSEYFKELLDIGPADRGYQWKDVLIRNGSKLRMSYRGRDYLAVVRHGHVRYEGESLSPSEFAATVANGTRRNAWRDLWVQSPDASDGEWVQAAQLRKRVRRRERV